MPKKTPQESNALAQISVAIEMLLDNHKMNRKDLAKALRVSQSRISQIMSCDHNMSIRTLAKVGKVFGRQIAVIFLKDGEKRA